MTNAEHDKDMIESIEMWLHECLPKYVEKELAWLDELRTRLIEEETPKDLEEAAQKYLDELFGKGKHQPFYKDLFIAGAKWQEDHTPLPEDTVLFNKGVAEGRRLAEEEQADLFTIVALDAAQRAKEQMMEDAVEGEFLYTPYPTIALDDCKDYNFKDNQKVRIIIVKED